MPARSKHLFPPGFTLVELLITVSIIAILASVGLVTYSHSQAIGRDGKRRDDIRAIATALEAYYQKNGQYPIFSGITQTSADWATFTTDLNPDISQMPTDPGTYSYYYDSASGTDYTLCAELENPNSNDTVPSTCADPPYNFGINGGL